jgi:CheY-like chemotaxis protein
MPTVTIFSGAFCHGEEIARETAGRLGWRLVGDGAVMEAAAARFAVPAASLARTLRGGVSAFNNFTHERERNIGRLRLQVAEYLREDGLVLDGFCSRLVPAGIPEVLGVGVIAEIGYRVEQAARAGNAGPREHRRLWTDYLLKKDPWDAGIYDILIPTNKVPVTEAVQLIVAHAGGGAIQRTPASLRALEDFVLAGRVEVELGNRGHCVAVGARDGRVTLTINKHTLMLARIEEELKGIVSPLPGVTAVETKVGPGFYQGGMYWRFDSEMPSKVLLVDDERDFVQTLSERLLMRDMGLTVAYDGEEALSFIRKEEPEVIVLDLKMPGIDGLEVLRRVKAGHPGIEVIVLTGHGTKQDEEACMALGAFAYLEKPVDIEKLSLAMREAHRKASSGRSGGL